MPHKMRYLFLVVLVIIFSSNLNSQEINSVDDQPAMYHDKIEYNFDGALRFMFSPSETSSLTFFDISAGIGLGVIPGFWYIGIAGDIAIGTDWIALFSEDDEDSNDDNEEYSQFGLSIGARIYNKIKISKLEIIPFFGCDFMFIVIPLPYIGIEVFYDFIGIEYAYYLTNTSSDDKLHQLSITFRIPL